MPALEFGNFRKLFTKKRDMRLRHRVMHAVDKVIFSVGDVPWNPDILQSLEDYGVEVGDWTKFVQATGRMREGVGNELKFIKVFYWIYCQSIDDDVSREVFESICDDVWGCSFEARCKDILRAHRNETDAAFRNILDGSRPSPGLDSRLRADTMPAPAAQVAPSPGSPQPELTLPSRSTRDYHYTARTGIDILGRDRERAALKRYRGEDPGFFCWQLAGVAGQGKSRLALELVETAPEGWAAGFMEKKALKAFSKKWKTWIPAKPHLIVVDYVIAVTEPLKAAIQALAKRRNEFKVAVRLLIVERQPWKQSDGSGEMSLASTASWYAQLTARRNGDDAQLEDARYRDEDEKYANLIELEALETEHLVDIVTRIAERGAAPFAIESDEIGKLLERIDGKGRPLFAYFLGRALGLGRLDVTADAAALLDWVLYNDRCRRWVGYFRNGSEPPRTGDDPVPVKGSQEPNPSMRLALLATMLRKVDCDAFETLPGWSKASSEIRQQALIVCDRPIPTGAPPREIEGLEPDILGNWFVLQSSELGINTDWLAQTAWGLEPKQMSEFLVRIAQDFPEHPAALRLLAHWPRGRDAKDAYAGVASALTTHFWRADRTELAPGSPGAKAAITRAVRRAAAMENSDDMAVYGFCLLQGYGFEKRPKLGVRWLARAANAGQSVAMANLGYCYQHGDGVEADMATALDWYREGVAAGDGGAMTNLGVCYAHGDGVEADRATALDWYRKGAAAGDGRAMTNLGVCYQHGDGVEADIATALDWYRKGAAAGDGRAMASLGVCYKRGDGVEADIATALDWFRKGAAAGDGRAMASLGVCYKRGDGVEADIATALDWFRKGAAAGDGGAMANLGVCYERGDGVEADSATALEWFRKGVAAGDGRAMTNLGVCYQHGDGVEADIATALEWFRKGAAVGDGGAMVNLGLCYKRGDGVEADIAVALEWFRKGAAVGDGGAMANVGLCYQRGDGVKADMAAALEWFRKGAAAGDGGAMANLGVCYERGDGVEADSATALEWFRKGAAAGDGRAMTNLGLCYQRGDGVEADMATALDWYRKGAVASSGIAMANLGLCYELGDGVEAEMATALEWYRKGAKVGDPLAMSLLANGLISGKGSRNVDFGEAVRWARRALDAGEQKAATILTSIERCEPAEKRIASSLVNPEAADWPLEPLVPGDWMPIAGEAARDDIRTIWSFTAITERPGLVLLSLRRCTPGFYPECKLIEALFQDGEELRIACILSRGDAAILLDGTSPPIRAMNNMGYLDLGLPERCIGYLRFYGMAVCADGGHFHIIESPDPNWFEVAPEAGELKRLAIRMSPPKVIGETEATLTVEANVKYATVLFRASFAITRTGESAGMVDIVEVHSVEEGLPLHWEGFDRPFRRRGVRHPDQK